MDGHQRAAAVMGLWLLLYVCSRDQLELSPPEKEMAALQYASWGPQGNQLVSGALALLQKYNHPDFFLNH